jgi:hypothetical protein
MGIRPPTYQETVLLAAYTEAVKAALEAANKSAELIATAAFSIATAYGALVGLVAPKQSQAPIIVGLPFAALAAAVIAGLVGRMMALSLNVANDVDAIRRALEGAITRKRWAAGIALGAVAIGLVMAGYVVVTTYGGATAPASTSPTPSPTAHP